MEIRSSSCFSSFNAYFFVWLEPLIANLFNRNYFETRGQNKIYLMK